MKKSIVALAIALILIPLTGCSKPVAVSDPLTVPLRPELPRIKDAELVCLPDYVYRDLALRDTSWRHHVEKLETVILSTQ